MGDVWLHTRKDDAVEVRFGGQVHEWMDGDKFKTAQTGYQSVIAVPHDLYISGYGSKAVNKLTLWSASMPQSFDMNAFSRGDYVRALEQNTMAEAISKVLYPADNHINGKRLRLRQQYLLCSATVQDLLRQCPQRERFAEQFAVQLNDTHPAMSIPELIRLLMLEGILTFSYKGASPALMGACAERGIGLTFLTPRGRFLARVCGSERGNVLLRREQYRRADSLSASCLIARNFIFGKVYNQRWVLERTIRDHALRVNVQALKDVSAALDAKLPQIESAVDLDVLRGLEGDASADYFSVFDEMILTQKADFLLNGRNRRPPQDNMNALLSFAYVLLANDCAAALESVGLDAYVGFMHRDRPGRTSLALDLMEELRAPMADRLCITLVNNRVLQDKHFDRQESGAVFLNDAGRKQFLTAWQNRKREEITHPFLKEKIMWGLVPYVQALLLARTLRGDTDGYPPFLWK